MQVSGYRLYQAISGLEVLCGIVTVKELRDCGDNREPCDNTEASGGGGLDFDLLEDSLTPEIL